MAPAYLRSLLPPSKEERRAAALQARLEDDDRTLWQCIRGLTVMQWSMFFAGWLAWTCDAIDFFAVSLSVTRLHVQFNRTNHDITTAITLTLLFRSVGAIIFGTISDRFGRKWPLVVNLLLCAVFELGSGFVQTFHEFLAVRSLFGIAMGGIWGMASSTALENLPVQVRGIASGILQQGYAFGYLIAAIINLTLVPAHYNHHSWRALFWTAAGISLLAAAVRAALPESQVFERAEREAAAGGAEQPRVSPAQKTRVFLREFKQMLRIHWIRCIYAVLLMTGFNFLSHGSQDLYPTYLRDSKGLSDHLATVATIIGNVGAIVGGTIAGFTSQYLGRRLTIVLCILFVGAFIPLWILPDNFHGLAAGAFFVQFGVQGAWGVIPIALAEMSPPAFRATFPGVAYQLGNAVSSASAQIEATGGDHLRTTLNGVDVPDYAKVQGILIGVVAIYTIFLTLIGPENHGARFEKHRVAFEDGGGRDEAFVADMKEREILEREKRHETGSGHSEPDEKGRVVQREHGDPTNVPSTT